MLLLDLLFLKFAVYILDFSLPLVASSWTTLTDSPETKKKLNWLSSLDPVTFFLSEGQTVSALYLNSISLSDLNLLSSLLSDKSAAISLVSLLG